MTEETGWYASDQKPVRCGIYERREECLCCVSAIWWAGTRFYNANFSGEIVGFIGEQEQNNIIWRGLAAAPTESK